MKLANLNANCFESDNFLYSEELQFVSIVRRTFFILGPDLCNDVKLEYAMVNYIRKKCLLFEQKRGPNCPNNRQSHFFL